MTKIDDREEYPRVYRETEKTPRRCGLGGFRESCYYVAKPGDPPGFYLLDGRRSWEFHSSTIYASEQALLDDHYQLAISACTPEEWFRLRSDLEATQ